MMADPKTKSDRTADVQSTNAEVVELENTIEIQNERVAADQQDQDATEETEAEVPAENIAHISDASLPSREELAAAADKAARAAAKVR
jgi:hypothetical protein